MIALAVHYSQPPDWRWYILGYFFVAGLAGGAYALGTIQRLWGGPGAESAARLCFLLALPLTLLCPLLLTVDLGHPLRFWHMLIDTGVAGPGLNFAYWSPMSVGAWALLAFGLFAALTFLEVLALDGRYSYPGSQVVVAVLGRPAGRVVNVVGTVLGLFVASYTGVLLSVSNQPVWSDTYALGGLFLASGMSGAAALVTLFARWRPGAANHEALAEADRYFALLEVAFIAVLFATLAFAGALARTLAPPWSLLWAVAILSLLLPLAGGLAGPLATSGDGAATTARVGISRAAIGAVIVLLGVLALRAAVLWSAQG
jgi:formate-dependent nitrite reductase membrane component NrfD